MKYEAQPPIINENKNSVSYNIKRVTETEDEEVALLLVLRKLVMRAFADKNLDNEHLTFLRLDNCIDRLLYDIANERKGDNDNEV